MCVRMGLLYILDVVHVSADSVLVSVDDRACVCVGLCSRVRCVLVLWWNVGSLRSEHTSLGCIIACYYYNCIIL